MRSPSRKNAKIAENTGSSVKIRLARLAVVCCWKTLWSTRHTPEQTMPRNSAAAQTFAVPGSEGVSRKTDSTEITTPTTARSHTPSASGSTRSSATARSVIIRSTE